MALVRSGGNSSLLEMDAIHAMCNLEMKLTTIHNYDEFCQVKFYTKECCRPWSIPNYIAMLSNRTTCHEVQVCFEHTHFYNFMNNLTRELIINFFLKENDLLEMKQILRDCHRYYRDGSLKSDCENVRCSAPTKCMQFNAVYNILHFLADNKFNVSHSNAIFSII